MYACYMYIYVYVHALCVMNVDLSNCSRRAALRWVVPWPGEEVAARNSLGGVLMLGAVLRTLTM